MDEEFDWQRSESEYWAQYGSLAVQDLYMQLRFKQERRAEMSLFGRFADWLVEQLFPLHYRRFNYTVWQRPLMRLIYKDGTPSRLCVRAPLPRLKVKNPPEDCTSNGGALRGVPARRGSEIPKG
jgi:hypothetical protein